MPLDIAHDIMTSNEVAKFLKLKRITINKFYNAFVEATKKEKRAANRAKRDPAPIWPHTQRLPGVFKGRDVMFRRIDVEVFHEFRKANL